MRASRGTSRAAAVAGLAAAGIAAVGLAAAGVPVAGAAVAPTAAPPRADDGRAALEAEFAADVEPFLADFCVACHSHPDPAGKLDLGRFGGLDDVQREDVLWRYLARRVALGQMPPDGEYAPQPDERRAFVAWIERALARRYDPALPPDPGAGVVRRLTRAQARATVRDLFGVDVDVAALLPPDDVALDFEGVGSAQHLPAAGVDGLLAFARTVAAEAIRFDAHGWPAVVRYEAEALDPERRGFLASPGEVGVRHDFGRAGAYRVRFAAWADQAGPDPARAALASDGDALAVFDVLPERGEEPQVHALDLAVRAPGPRRIGVQFVNDYYRPDDPDPGERDRNLAVVWLAIEGPFDPPEHPPLVAALLARHGLALDEPASRGERRALLADLATHVWRRPPADRDLARLVVLTDDAEPLGAALRLGLEALLASPRFWFRLEEDAPQAPPVRALDGHELAVRLSYWLWGSTPDARLLERAAGGALTEPRTLADEVDRLLADPRARWLAEDFAPQWLALSRLADRGTDAPDGDDAALLASMRRETELLFEAVLREQRPLVTLLEADFTFVDARLAEHYDLPGVDGPYMRRVSLAGTGRRGILGHASVLTATSDPARTSPVLRGKWILDALLGTPPAPPPDDVPALPPGVAGSPTSLREELARHRAEPTCAVCHDTLDPLGLALEAFGPRGRRRTFDGDRPIDDRATLPDGRAVRGASELVDVLADDPRFLRTFAEKLMVVAVGRALEAPDRGEIARIVAELDPRTATIRDVVQAVAATHAFRLRRTIAPPPDSRRPL